MGRKAHQYETSHRIHPPLGGGQGGAGDDDDGDGGDRARF
jgi:hypothetical protein